MKNFLAVLIIALTLVGCGGGGSTPNNNLGVNAIQLVSISSLSADELTVDWLAQSGSTSAYVSNTEFTIHASIQEGFTPSDSNKKTQVIDKDSAVITGLTSNTQYFVKVSTIVNGERIWSNELSVKTVSVQLKLSSAAVRTQSVNNAPKVSNNEIVYTDTQTPAIGEILISAQGDGYLRKVKTVTEENGKHKVTTESAALNEVFEDLEFSTIIKSTPISEIQNNSGLTNFKANTHVWDSGLTLTHSAPKDAKKTLTSNLNNTIDTQTNTGDYFRLRAPVKIIVQSGKYVVFDVEATQFKDYYFNKVQEVCGFSVNTIHPNKDSSDLVQLDESNSNSMKKRYYVTALPRHVDNEGDPYRVMVNFSADTRGDCGSVWPRTDTLSVEVLVYVVNGELVLPVEISTTFNSSLTVEHSLTAQYKPEIKVSAKIQNSQLKEAEVILTGDYRFDQDFTLKGSAGSSVSIEKSIINPIHFVKVFSAGPVPVVVRGDLRLRIAVEGQVDGEVNLNQHLAMIFDNSEFGFKYNADAGGFEPVKNLKKEYKFTIDGDSQAKAELTIKIIPDVKISFYDAASARLRLEPYATGEVGVQGHFKYFNDGTNNNFDADYHFDPLEVRAGLDVYLFAGLQIFSIDVVSWPDIDDIDDALNMADGNFNKSLFEAFHPVGGENGVKILGIPALTLVCNTSTKPADGVDSRAVACQGSASEVANPFGGNPFITFDAWDSAKITGTTLTNGTDYEVNPVNDKTGAFDFIPKKSATYNVQIAGHSNLGYYIRQVANTNITTADDNNNNVLDYWETRYGLTDTSSDKDNDGFSNLAEYQAGTDPTNNQSTPKLQPNLSDLPMQTLTQNAQTSFVFSNTGGNVVSCSNTSSLPLGLRVVMANNTCQITGMPTTPQEAQTYTITATNANGTDSATVEIVVVANTLSPPTNLTATAGNQQISLNWTGVTGASYKLHRATESFGTKVIAEYDSLQGYNAASVSASNKTITGLTNNTRYYFVVTAVKNSIESSASNEATATPILPASTLTPSNLIASAGNEEISLEWDNVDGASYNLYYAQESITDIQNYATLNGGTLLNNLSANTKTVTGLTNDTPYYFVVTAVKNSVESSASNQVTATPKTPVVLTATGKLNDTGITWGGDYPSGNNTTCTGEKISAQDCSHGRDAQAAAGTLTKIGAGNAGFDWTKLDSSGNPLPASASSWSCVQDNHTGLIWEVKTDDGGIHDKDNTYRWGGKTALGKEHPQRMGNYYNDWNSLVDGSNSGSGYCGFTNWRVPTRAELRSIVNYDRHNPAIDTSYFPNTPAIGFWSSSPFSHGATDAWLLYFSYGIDGNYYRGNSFRVRLVRPRE